MTAPAPPKPSLAKHPLWLIAKIAIFALAIWFVGGAFRESWHALQAEGLRIDPLLAIASGALLIAAQTPSAWFWRQCLRALGEPAPYRATAAAYLVSQIGKYIPGKAAAVAIRIDRMIGFNTRPAAIAACSFYETLTLMAVGCVISAVLLTLRMGSEQGSLPWIAAAFAVLCVAPTTPPLAKWLTRRLAKIDVERAPRGFTWLLMAEGGIASLAAWTLLAMSVCLAARAVGVDSVVAPADWLLAATLPVVAGFLSMLPGGVLVRDGLMLEVLAPTTGQAGALATAVATRIIWITAEVLVCVILVGASARRTKRPA
ncbi:lysylphosphatidylglycerol synthase domain-containing protein [Botrimarina hoheduenensis]|uniref:Lysylphosphatidylglycerol synthase TM region n=1 Tax=Botrimarina hoheduenensis TaxID=2528000 RepID=A0A5C5VYA9_9BACT|nr:lysylphosphatidylglycerol synthase domain-containing protein [Botrimarina hoheduenensis]TWT42709.1 hypothetical protein Pla111_26820 [Botrimarina hoheduenensis]